jgi:hypothetical protein
MLSPGNLEVDTDLIKIVNKEKGTNIRGNHEILSLSQVKIGFLDVESDTELRL